MRKVFHKLHLWLSIPLGLIISAICLSGAALVFESEIMQIAYLERYNVEKVGKKTLPIDGLVEKVTLALPDSVSVTGITISANPGKAYQVSLSKPRRASIAVDQYTGEVKERNERAGFFTFMFRMHRWLLDSVKPGELPVGKTIVGISTLLLIFILISGIVVWIPRNRKALKNRLKISACKGTFRFWYDLHVSGGIYVAVVLLALALTGLTWSFPWYRTAFYSVFGVEVVQSSAHGRQQTVKEHSTTGNSFGHGHQAVLSGKKQTSPDREMQNRFSEKTNSTKDENDRQSQKLDYTNWQKVYEQLTEQEPTHRQVTISDGSASVAFQAMGNQRATDKYTFDPENGEITGVSLYKDQEKAGKIRGWIYSVHVGNWGGWLTRILTFIAALLGGALPLTGYYLWIKKGMNKRRQRKNR